MTLQQILGIELPIIQAPMARGLRRVPFDAAAAELLREFKPPVVSFHYGLPSAELLAQVRAWGAKIVASATTVDEARWLEAHGADLVVAPLRAQAEACSSGDFSPLWCGQNVSGCKEVSAAYLTRELAGVK